MTQRYIEAGKVKYDIEKLCEEYAVSYGVHYGGFGGYLSLIIDNQPTADVVEVRHGKWVGGRYNSWQNNGYEEQCSECLRYSKDWGRDFCSNCGAKMDLEE